MTYADAINYLKIGQTVYWTRVTEDNFSLHVARVEGIVTRYGKEAYIYVSSLPDKPLFHEDVTIDPVFALERAHRILQERAVNIQQAIRNIRVEIAGAQNEKG